MSSHKSREARRIANAYATRNKIWDKGILPKRPWHERLLAYLFKSHRAKTMKQEMDMRGRWYKRVLKDLAKQVRDRMRDPDYAEMERVKRKLAKKRK